ncbi:MaoC/PaaZ C-terminal domain-containing protein [Actinomyces sp. 565]|uniref:MaoC/PaaZ C-terminal domain-containing protein n=1 Tax=Actinomyces sp. 565 TaxID=2057794 RepID=UPI0013A6DE45|nr:MaoC/PaaZ C-terminal domain-containing protein [Actinomyces sp. 565]NDR54473.1 hypothetical protein [Actinomyces sp. 565]
MAQVLAAVLARLPSTHREPVAPDTSGADCGPALAPAALVLAPAVVALAGLADRLPRYTGNAADGTGGRDLTGFIHRRCRITPADVVPADARGRPASRDLEPTMDRTVRGGWELVHSTVLVCPAGPGWATGARVTHDLARRTAAAAPAPGGPVPASGAEPVRELVLTAAHVRDWARATGDHNPIHLRAGAARRAGLPVGEGDVVAHGLLLGAISLALAPASGTVDLRFTGAVPLPAGGSVALHVDAGGGISTGGHSALLRR